MKNTLSFLVIVLISCYHVFGQEDPISAFQIKWENSKQYLIDVAEAMPEESYSYKPTSHQMTFKEQLLHIRRNMLWLSHDYIAEKEWKETDHNELSKEETIRLLAAAFDEVSEIVSQMVQNDLNEKVEFKAGVKTRLQILNLIQDHVSHHRGQLIVYLNLQGIEPPKYVGW